MSIIAAIKERLSVRDYAESRGVVLAKEGRLWRGRCPLHTDSSPSFTIYEDDTWHCFGCQAHGDLLDLFCGCEAMSTNEAIEELAHRLGIPRNKHARRNAERLEKLIGYVTEAAGTYHKWLLKANGAASARDYAQQRGLTEEQLAHWQIGYAPTGDHLKAYLLKLGANPKDLEDAGLVKENRDRFYTRLMFPIHDERGRVVGFGARALAAEQQPKYLNSSDSDIFHKGKMLYGFHQAKASIKAQKSVILVEGYMDVIAAHSVGYTNTVATMGTSLSADQLKLLEGVEKIIFCMDGDKPGVQAVQRALEQMNHTDADVRIARLPDEQDVDDAVKAGTFEHAILTAISAPEYVIDRTMLDVNEDMSIQERTVRAQRVLPLLLKLDNDTIRMTAVQLLAHRLRINVTALMHDAEKMPEKSHQTAPVSIQQKTISHTMEEYVLACFIQHPEWLDEIETEIMRADFEPLSRADFPRTAHLYAVIAQHPREHNNIIQAISEQLGEDAIPETLDVVSYEKAVAICIELRLKRIQREVEHAILQQNVTAIHACNRRKSAILRIISGRS